MAHVVHRQHASLGSLLGRLPRGRTLPDATWRDRHRWLLALLGVHLLGLPVFGLLQGWSLLAALLAVVPAAALGALAVVAPGGRTVRASCAALGLLSCSAALVVLWHGTIEAHFHYFVMTAALALYEEWAVYGLAVGYVVLQHGLMSQVRGDAVFAHPMAMGGGHSMWAWAAIHGGFILAQSVANVVSWRATEAARQEAAEALASVRHQADHDQLTGLVNRSRFERELEVALQGDPHGVVGLVFVDLDDFKRTNDLLGHAAGDELLVTMAGRLRDALRPQDVVGRFGGDEFVVCLAAADRAEVERVADRIALALRAPLLLADEVRSTTASIGVAVAPTGAAHAEALLRNADVAMYAAKRDGKARRRTYAPALALAGIGRGPAAVVPEAFDVAAPAALDELDRLVREDAVTAVYQPVVELATGAVVGYEALARGPVGSSLERPDRLFAVAAQHGRTPGLDWACRIAALRGAAAAGLPEAQALFVNVEPMALGHPCPEHLAPVLDAVPDDAQVVVEVTERELTQSPAKLLAAVARVRAHGWRVALDDVGADPRSLALMPLLRPDVIKLDLRLVQQRSSQAIAEIVSAVNAEAERTGALVLAEGIETEEHLATARAFGAAYAQGWLFGRPGPLPVGGAAAVGVRWPTPARSAHPGAEPPAASTPYAAVTARMPARRGDKRLLLEMTRMLEEHAARLGEGAVVASAFQDATRFTSATVERYARLACDAALVAALGVGMAAEPAPRVRGAAIGRDDPLRDEWSVVVLGPHFAGALVAVDLGDPGPDETRRFDFALTYDRGLVIAALAALVGRVEPVGGADAPAAPARALAAWRRAATASSSTSAP